MRELNRNKLERNQIATLHGIPSHIIDQAKAQLGRSFTGGADNEFVTLCKSIMKSEEDGSDRMFTKG